MAETMNHSHFKIKNILPNGSQKNTETVATWDENYSSVRTS